jgi:RNA polymerase sigma factor (sigma-70 family)
MSRGSPAVHTIIERNNRMTDTELLDQYARLGDSAAFGVLVQRHIGLVYAAARRHVGDVHLAEDVTQAVFVLLAAKASGLRHQAALPAWLLTATRYASKDALKMCQRRRRHEAAAARAAMERGQFRSLDASVDAEMNELVDQLDEALDSLNQRDRQAVLLRYYEKQPFARIGSALGIDEETARKRVSRATNKMTRFFATRGCTVTSVLLAVLLSRELAQAAPAQLVGRVIDVATASGSAISGGAAIENTGGGAPVREVVARLASAIQRQFIFSAARTTAIYGGALVLVCAACALGTTYQLTRPPTTQPTQHWAVVQFDGAANKTSPSASPPISPPTRSPTSPSLYPSAARQGQ